MPEYIERETLLTHTIALNNLHELGENVVPVSDIEAAPAADVADVVRCGECEHRIFVEVGDVGQIGVCEIFGCAMQISSFCSYGKRKENT